ncbi:MAG: hypothetical protein CMK33_05680 [Porticoccaceae bacterium]|nr:hypothetical protein [Porticoccaceae bacterium]
MRRMMTAVALSVAMGATAYADCTEEVANALKRQRETSGFRMDTSMIAPEGKVKMTVEYVLPDRMRQVISSQMDPDPVETILVGNLAWTRRKGDPWTPVNSQLTAALVKQMQENLGDDAARVGDYECLGKKDVSGKNLLAYQGENESGGPKNLREDKKPKLPDRPVRVMYVDPTTGLPMRSIFARANKLDKPIFEAVYSYPADIKIESPLEAKKASSGQ